MTMGMGMQVTPLRTIVRTTTAETTTARTTRRHSARTFTIPRAHPEEVENSPKFDSEASTYEASTPYSNESQSSLTFQSKPNLSQGSQEHKKGSHGSQGSRKPLLIVPGFGGSILVKTGMERKRVFAKQKRILDNRWLNIAPLSPRRMDQWNAEMTGRRTEGTIQGLEFDMSIRPLEGIRGIIDMVPEFELLTTTHQDWLDLNFNYKYFGHLVRALKDDGYVEDIDLCAAPYDFRAILDPTYRARWFNDLQIAIEGAKGKCVVLCHSLGAILFKWFLSTHVSAEWAHKHVDRFICVNAPFGGTTVALKAMYNGEYFIPIFAKQFQAGLQLNSGILMCLPNEYAYRPDEILGVLESRFAGLDSSYIGCHTLKKTSTAWRDLYAPHLPAIMTPIDVPAHIVTTGNIDTLQTFRMRTTGEAEDVAYEPGDGQVAARSLRVAHDLFVGADTFHTHILDCSHIAAVSDPRLIQLVREALG